MTLFPTSDLFSAFRAAYPRKEAKEAARKVFIRLRVDAPLLEAMARWLDAATRSDQWRDRRFIPHASTWLNQRRWESDPPPIGKDRADLLAGSFNDEFVRVSGLPGLPLNDAETTRRCCQAYAEGIEAKPRSRRTVFETQWLETWRKKNSVDL